MRLRALTGRQCIHLLGLVHQRTAATQIQLAGLRERDVAPPRDPDRPALTIIGRLQAKPGRGQELRAALEPVVEASRRESGCINYDLHVSETNPDHFTIYENWVDQAALDLHFEQPHSRALAERLPELLATELTMERLTEISGWIGRRS